jgi:hypothetical protein
VWIHVGALELSPARGAGAEVKWTQNHTRF